MPAIDDALYSVRVNNRRRSTNSSTTNGGSSSYDSDGSGRSGGRPIKTGEMGGSTSSERESDGELRYQEKKPKPKPKKKVSVVISGGDKVKRNGGYVLIREKLIYM